MKVAHYDEITCEPVGIEGADGCTVRWLVDKSDGAPNFAMRRFEIQPGGHTPKHTHPYEHEVYVLEGEGVVLDGDVERSMRKDDVIYVAPDELHQFRNTGRGVLKVLCLVPNVAPR